MRKQKNKIIKKKFSQALRIRTILIFLILFSFLAGSYPAFSSSLSEKREELENIQDQISSLQGVLEKTQGQVRSLKEEIALMNAQISETSLEIAATSNQIEITEGEIAEVKSKISQKEEEIKYQERILNESLQILYQEGDSTTLEILVTYSNFSEFLSRIDYLDSLEQTTIEVSNQLNILKNELESQKSDLETKKANLGELKAQLEDKKIALDAQKYEKNQLLATTQGKEANYQKQLTEVQEKEKEIFTELIALESQQSGSNRYTGSKDGRYYGYFIWPMKKYILTQDYGMTSYAKTGVYGGWGHNGIDIAWTYGSPIYAAASGRVLRGTHQGWGNWVAIQHPNGLTTLYAHLSRFARSSTSWVNKGQIIGYEGSTGASTGPHLHFSVYWDFWTVTSYRGYGPAYNYPGTLNPLTVLP